MLQALAVRMPCLKQPGQDTLTAQSPRSMLGVALRETCVCRCQQVCLLGMSAVQSYRARHLTLSLVQHL